MPAKKGKKNRKVGRNAKKCEAYRLTKSRPNKLKKLKRHLSAHPSDACAQTALQVVKSTV